MSTHLTPAPRPITHRTCGNPVRALTHAERVEWQHKCEDFSGRDHTAFAYRCVPCDQTTQYVAGDALDALRVKLSAATEPDVCTCGDDTGGADLDWWHATFVCPATA